MHLHYVYKIVEFDEIAQADGCLFVLDYFEIYSLRNNFNLLRHVPQLMVIFNTSKRSHASLHPGKTGSCKQPLDCGSH